MFKLLRYFALSSLVALIIVTVLLAVFYRQIAIDQLVSLEESKNVALTKSFANTLWPEFAPLVTDEPMLGHDDPVFYAEVARLNAAVKSQMSGLSVIKVKIYDIDGETVFSTEAAQIGENQSTTLGFQTARSGQIASELAHRDTFSALEGEISDRDVVSSYIPIQPAGPDGPVEGVFELYSDVTLLVERIEATRRNVILGVSAIQLVLYLVLYLIVRRADTILRFNHHQRTEAEAALQQAKDELEDRVQERTVEFQGVSERLQGELLERLNAEVERERLLVAEREQRQLAESLGRMGQALNATLDLTTLLDLICEESIALFEVEAALVWLVEGEELVGFAGYGPVRDDFIGLRLPLTDPVTLGPKVIREQRPYYVNNAEESALVNQDLTTRFQAKAILGAPLMKGDRAVGALMIISIQNPLKFEPKDVQAALLLGSQAAIAIDNARLFRDAEQRALELSTLLEAARAASSTIELDTILALIAEQMVKVLDVDGCALSRWDKELDAVVTWVEARQNDIRMAEEPGVAYPIDHYPATRRVLEEAVPLVVQGDDPQADPDEIQLMREFGELSVLMLPLMVGNHVIGLVELDDSTKKRSFTAADIRLCQALANQAAIAIKNVRLYEETQRRVERLAALRTIDNTITASLDLRVTLAVLLEQVTNTLGVSAAAVLQLDSRTQRLERTARRGFFTGHLNSPYIRLGEGFAGLAALERRTISLPNLEDAEGEELARSNFPEKDFAAYFAVPLLAKGQVKGVLEVFHDRPLTPDAEWVEFLETLAGQTAIAIDNAALFEELQRSNTELTLAYDTTLEGWARALELRDKDTIGHSQRVTEMTLHIARALNIRDTDLVHIYRGAVLHDIGKMGIPDSILLKPGPLTDDEWVIMRQHPTYAYQMLSPIAYLRPALEIPYCHHERWNGSGYPRGLRDEGIPLAARIFAVVDVWDALCSDRPYRAAWDVEKALDYIRGNAGKLFDPRVVEIFFTSLTVMQGLMESRLKSHIAELQLKDLGLSPLASSTD
jgi:HD-GYP domain-containing protein (c-di-GMP phosphodiesterase class II)